MSFYCSLSKMVILCDRKLANIFTWYEFCFGNRDWFVADECGFGIWSSGYFRCSVEKSTVFLKKNFPLKKKMHKKMFELKFSPLFLPKASHQAANHHTNDAQCEYKSADHCGNYNNRLVDIDNKQFSLRRNGIPNNHEHGKWFHIYNALCEFEVLMALPNGNPFIACFIAI